MISLSVTTHAAKVVGFKSIAAYRSGLEINTDVSKKDAEEGLSNVLQGMFYMNGFKTSLALRTRLIVCLFSWEARPHHE